MNPTGRDPLFRSLYRQSLAGSRINEDGLGLLGPCAWIVDGATGLSTEQLTKGGSDAAWLADAIGAVLERLAGTEGHRAEILRHLEAEVAALFKVATAHLPGHHLHHVPSACLGLVRVQAAGAGKARIEGFFLGDVVALVPTEQGIVRWTDERSKPFEKKTLAALDAGGHEPGRMPEAVRRQILENRGRLNQPDGYWVVSPCHPWAGHELRFEAEVQAGETIALATDGFMRLVDVFSAYTDRSLHAALSQGRGDDLIEELRALERGDSLSGSYPRVKTHDDATVLVIAAETDG